MRCLLSKTTFSACTSYLYLARGPHWESDNASFCLLFPAMLTVFLWRKPYINNIISTRLCVCVHVAACLNTYALCWLKVLTQSSLKSGKSGCLILKRVKCSSTLYNTSIIYTTVVFKMYLTLVFRVHVQEQLSFVTQLNTFYGWRNACTKKAMAPCCRWILCKTYRNLTQLIIKFLFLSWSYQSVLSLSFSPPAPPDIWFLCRCTKM